MGNSALKRLEMGKLYYSISEVCEQTGLEPHVLRYWEAEFPQLRPKKNRSGNRAYRPKEIKLVHYIKWLLYDQGFTIAGANKKLSEADLSDLEGQMSLLPAAAVTRRVEKPEEKANDISNEEPVTLEIPTQSPSTPSRDELLRIRDELKVLLQRLT